LLYQKEKKDGGKIEKAGLLQNGQIQRIVGVGSAFPSGRGVGWEEDDMPRTITRREKELRVV